MRPLQTRPIFSEPTSTGSLWTRSGEIAEFKWWEPGTKWGLLPNRSSSWSGYLPQPVRTGFQPSRDILFSYRSWRRHPQLLLLIFLRKRNKVCSTNQSQIRSENTLEANDSDENLLALQQLASKNNSAKIHNNINRISKLPNSFKTTLLTFDGKSEKFEVFEDLFGKSLKIHNQPTEGIKINHFHSLMKRNALQTFKIISRPTGENMGAFLPVFRKKNVKHQSMAKAKHKFQKNVKPKISRSFWRNPKMHLENLLTSHWTIKKLPKC